MTTSSDKPKQRLVAIIGPTAVGKTALVLRLAQELDAEIVNIDSMQIYRHMDVGTAKPSKEELQAVKHHLIDIVNPDEEYNVGCFIRDAERVCPKIIARQKLPILTGGTGLYLKGLQEGVFASVTDDKGAENEKVAATRRAGLEDELAVKGREYLFEKLQKCDPLSAARIHPNDTYRLLRALLIYEQTNIPWSTHLALQQESIARSRSRQSILKIGLTCNREQLYERINLRTEKMFEMGLLAEIQTLLEMGYSPELKSMQAIGYRHGIKLLTGEWDKDETIRLLARDTRHYAKRQLTWFKKDGEIKWFKPSQTVAIAATIKAYLN